MKRIALLLFLLTQLSSVQLRASDIVWFDGTLDEQEPVVISLKEKFRSEGWKQNVLRGQAQKARPVKVRKGIHSLRIKALDDPHHPLPMDARRQARPQVLRYSRQPLHH